MTEFLPMQSVDELLELVPFCVWAYNEPMEVVNFPPQFGSIGASGECPHCRVRSYFQPVGGTHQEQVRDTPQYKIVSAAQCQACKGFLLVQGLKPFANQPAQLVNVFPLGKANESVDSEVSPPVADDFKEALRCEWVQAYKGCVVMCRRAVQGSVIELGAKDGRLIDQIDELFSKGKITEALKDFAHEVRLTGNDGAHPGKDGLADVSPKDASDIIEFTREYLHHVYVMPAKLKARKPSAAAAVSSPTTK
jgi:hypothetical protein